MTRAVSSSRRRASPDPDAPLGVVPTPAFLRPVIPYAAYDSPGAYTASARGGST